MLCCGDGRDQSPRGKFNVVSVASYHGLPVSTTHVSVGSLLGIGITTCQAQWKPVIGVLLSRVILRAALVAD